jgi:hypothetical protein
VAFVALNVAGTAARLIAIRVFAAAFTQPLDDVLSFVSRYRWWLVGVSIALGLLELYRGRRVGREPVKTAAIIERELEEEADVHHGGAGDVDVTEADPTTTRVEGR